MQVEIMIVRDGTVQKGGDEHSFNDTACSRKEQCDVYEDAIVKHLEGDSQGAETWTAFWYVQ
jgi:hypothetical protein